MKKTTKTISAKDVNQQWWLFDASNQVLGRFASEVAQVLRGKHRPDYSPIFTWEMQLLLLMPIR